MIINVKTKNSSYDVIVENNCLNKANNYFNLNRKVLIVTDDGVPFEYVNIIKSQCKESLEYIISQGEESKNFDNFKNILEFLVINNFTRTDCIVAVGGGVVGDLAGFVASTFNRGIDFYNVPTTLLSQVDSSIGGKTAIDFCNLKNIVGAFYPPKCVLIDPLTLQTLDKRQLHSGLVEAIKMALTFNESLFEFIEKSTLNNDDLNKIICESLKIKKYVVETDEFEGNIRKVLNFGHSVGHCIESLSSLIHGEAVGIGMLYFSSIDIKDRIISVLNKFNLPTNINLNKLDILNKLIHDKKASGNYIDIVFVEKIGQYQIKKMSIEEISKIL